MGDFAQERLAICNACPYNENMECVICGCDLNIKPTVPEEFCPLSPGSKWGPYSEPAPIVSAPPEAVPVNAPKPPCRTCGGRNR